MKQRVKTQKDLTPRELELVKYISMGYTDEETACSMNISKLTIRQYIHDILENTGTFNRPQLVYWACKKNLI